MNREILQQVLFYFYTPGMFDQTPPAFVSSSTKIDMFLETLR